MLPRPHTQGITRFVFQLHQTGIIYSNPAADFVARETFPAGEPFQQIVSWVFSRAVGLNTKHIITIVAWGLSTPYFSDVHRRTRLVSKSLVEALQQPLQMKRAKYGVLSMVGPNRHSSGAKSLSLSNLYVK